MNNAAQALTAPDHRTSCTTPLGLPRQGLPPRSYFLVSAVFHYLGPALAVLLFARLDELGVAWLRIATATALFAMWRRPWRLLASAFHVGVVAVAWVAVGWCERRPGSSG